MHPEPDQARDGDDAFEQRVGAALAGLPAVEAVALGGSRATGTHRPDSVDDRLAA